MTIALIRLRTVLTQKLRWRGRTAGGKARPIPMPSAPGSPHSVAEHLARARTVLANREVWTQDAYARDVAGRIVESQSPAAVRFCCSGALYTTEHPLHGSVAARAIVSRVIGHDLEVWNDAPGRKHKDVLDVFDRAITLAKSEES